MGNRLRKLKTNIQEKEISNNKSLCGKIRLTDNLMKIDNLMKNGLL